MPRTSDVNLLALPLKLPTKAARRRTANYQLEPLCHRDERVRKKEQEKRKNHHYNGRKHDEDASAAARSKDGANLPRDYNDGKENACERCYGKNVEDHDERRVHKGLRGADGVNEQERERKDGKKNLRAVKDFDVCGIAARGAAHPFLFVLHRFLAFPFCANRVEYAGNILTPFCGMGKPLMDVLPLVFV